MKKTKEKPKMKMFTKDEIIKTIKLWDSKTTTEIAEDLNRPTASIAYLASQIKKAGYILPKKHKAGITQCLIKETLKELRLI